MGRYVDVSFRNFLGSGPQIRPSVEILEPAAVFERFCGGLGTDYPDVAASARRMSRVEFRQCGENGVGDVVEIGLGFELAALFTKIGSPPLSLTSEQVYRALAADVPRDGEFVTNTAKTWRDINRSLPNVDIRFVTSGPGTAWRSILDDKILQAGCRHVPEVRGIYAADRRVALCTGLRGDSRLTEAPSPAKAMESLETLPRGTIAVIPLDLAETSRNRLQAVALDGTLPSEDDIESGKYQLSRRLYYYFKVGHMRDRKGYGVTLNLLEFMVYAATEASIGPTGYLVREGLLPLPEEMRARQRRDAALLQPMVR